MLFVGDDWAEDHHDVELKDTTGRRLARALLLEGLAGIARLHELIAAAAPEHDDGGSGDAGGPDRVWIGIETVRGPWVQALIAAGYRVSRATRGRSPAIANDGYAGAKRLATSCARCPGIARWWPG